MTVTSPAHTSPADRHRSDVAGATAIAAATDSLREAGPSAYLDAARSVAVIAARHADTHDRAATFPSEAIEAIWASGLGTLILAKEDGGLDANLATVVGVLREIAVGDPSAALIFAMTLSHEWQLREQGAGYPDHLRDLLIRELREGPALINTIRGEHLLGSPLFGGLPATTATWVPDASSADGGAWSISGEKAWATGSTGLRWFSVWAVTADDPTGEQRIGNFLVRGDTAGLTIVPTWDSLGMRGTVSHDLVLDGVVVSDAFAVDLAPVPSKDTLASPFSPLAGGRVSALFLAIYQGAAHAAAQWYASFLHDRVPPSLGAPLATLPHFQRSLGEVRARLRIADRLIETLVDGIEAGSEDAGRDTWQLKSQINENLIAAAEIPISVLGNPGLSYANPLQRHYRNLLQSRAHGPDTQQTFSALGRQALGL